MGYFFDLEDFETTCRAMGDAFLKSANQDNLANRAKYYQQYGNYDGYKPSQETIVLNNDGSIDFFIANRGTQKLPIEYGGYCCKYRLPFIMELAKTNIGVFEGVDTTAIYWDANKQSCRWKQEPEYCALDSFKVILNAVNNDGAMFNVDNDDKECSLTIDFDYLFKMDCQNLASILNPSINTNADPILLSQIKILQNSILKVETECSQITADIYRKSNDFLNSKYSITSCPITAPFAYGKTAAALYAQATSLYCINEKNDGLTQWENILGPARYNRFLAGDVNSYTCADFTALMAINTQFVNTNKPPIIEVCTTPFGYKSNLKKEIDEMVVSSKSCQSKVDELQSQLNDLLAKLDTPSTCATPIEALETLDVSMTLEVVNSDGSLSTVFESPLFPTIGTGNLYSYLKLHPYDSGFYICGDDSTGVCTPLNYGGELTGPTVPFGFDLEDYATTYRNVEPCNIVKDSLLTDLKTQSGLGNTATDLATFKASLANTIFESKWLNFSTVIDDINVLDLFKNKKIKLSLKINNTCSNVCIYIDNIKLLRNCVDGNGNSVLISESPGFQLDRVIDNKKSWVRNYERVNRTFDIANNEGTNIIRTTDYDVNDERLVINTKEIDLDINIASAIENDVQCYINDNLGLLDSVPKYDCGCPESLPCYKDVFKIITHAEAVALTGTITQDPEDYATTFRAMRDAWAKAWNEWMLASVPYLDIKDAFYSPIVSDDTLTTYRATRDAYWKALNEFNLASGGGYIEGLTEKPNLLNDRETLVPMVFETKCGRILKFPSTSMIDEGVFYIVETPDKQIKLYTTDTSVAPQTTWIDLSNIIEEDYPLDWNLGGSGGTNIPERKEYFCKVFGSVNNHFNNASMTTFHYQTNNNTHVDKWLRPIRESFYIDWDSTKGKCMSNMFKQVVPEEFSMCVPITDITWLNDGGDTYSPQCDLDILSRNSGSTACSIYSIDWTWPNISVDIATIRRTYRDYCLKMQNEYFIDRNKPAYHIMVKDPLTNAVPDESGGIIPVKVTTTIRKGSVTGNIVFKEEYVLNTTGSGALNQLEIPIGITDPTSIYQNPLVAEYNFYPYYIGLGTHISGSTSTLPLPGASANGIDRNWTFDTDYYVHLDIVNNATNAVYYTNNNDFNLKDRNQPIKCPSSASTQTFNINDALSSMQIYKETVLGQIQEDLDWALNNCTNC